MSNQRQRLKTIELSLTPREVVLLWMKNCLPGTLEQSLFQSPAPRAAITKRVLRVVREALKGESEVVMEQAILQARREADWLYLLLVDVNHRVQQGFYSSMRERVFLLGWLSAEMQCSILSLSSSIFERALPIPDDLLQSTRSAAPSLSEEPLRMVTLNFVKSILLLEATVSRISAERFGGHSILFSDSIEQLNAQLARVDEVLGYYNLLARRTHFAELTKDAICKSLTPDVDQEVSVRVLGAKTTMLAMLGKSSELRAAFEEFDAICSRGSSLCRP